MASHLWTSRSWRYNAFPLFCTDYVIRLGAGVGQDLSIMLPIHDTIGIQESSHDLSNRVKTLSVSIDFSRIIRNRSGLFLSEDTMDEYQPETFLNAYTLRLHIYCTPFSFESSREIATMKSCVDDCVWYLRKLAPNVKEIKLGTGYYNPDNPSYFLHQELHRRLLCSAFQMASTKFRFSTTTSYKSSYLTSTDMDNMAAGNGSALTHLNLGKAHGVQYFQTIHECAATLQHLVVGWWGYDLDMAELIYDEPTETFVDYPCLKSLKIECNRHRGYLPKLLPTFPAEIAPFSGLENIHCRIPYPFGDDILFRGNKNTLKSVYLQLYPKLAQILEDNEVYYDNSHPNLRTVKLTGGVKDGSKNITNNESLANCVRLAASLGQNARVLWCKGFKPELFPYQVVTTNSSHLWHIQVLALEDTVFDILSAVELIKRLSYLHRLVLKDLKIVDCHSSPLTENMIKRYYPASLRFNILQITNSSHSKTYKTNRVFTECLLLLAMVCPHLHTIMLSTQVHIDPTQYSDYCMEVFQSLKFIVC